MISKRKAHRAAIAMALGAVAACPAHADDAVVITAARIAQPLNDALPHTTVLTRDDIDRAQAIDLAALLSGEAGLQFASNGGRGTATTLFMRGAPTRQVLVLVDGVPLARQDATGQVGIEHLMLDQIERIEIVRGNVSALYGGGAIGGVIQVFTRGASPGLAAQLEAGSRGLQHAGVRAAGGLGATNWSLAVSDQRERGFSALDPARVPQANPDRDGYRNRSLALNLAQGLAPGQTLALGLEHIDGRLDYDSAFASPADVQQSRTRKTIARVTSDNAINAVWTSRLMLSTQTDDARYDESGGFGSASRYRTTVRALNWSNELTLDRNTRAQAGLETQQQRVAVDDGFGGVYDPSRNLWALFGGVQTRFGAQDLALNLRHDHVGGNTGNRTTGRLGWGLALDGRWKLFASAADAFSIPPLGYLYAPFFGNPALVPERSRSAEFGAQWAVPGQRLRATLFDTRVRDELDYDLTSNRFENIARTRNRGLELSYNASLGRTDLRASVTAQHPVDDASGARRLRRSDTLASIAASCPIGSGLRVGLTARYAGARPDSGGVTLAAYTVADASAQWDLGRGWQWTARIENLGNARYQTAQGYNQPPRGFFTGLRWQALP